MVTLSIKPELKARIKLAAIRANQKVEEWLNDKCVESETKSEKTKPIEKVVEKSI